MEYPSTAQEAYPPQAFRNGGYSGSAGISVSPTVGISPLDELAKQLDAIATRLGSSTDRVRNVVDSLVGGNPEKDGGGGNRPSRPGRLGGLNDQAARILGQLSYLESEIARLGFVG